MVIHLIKNTMKNLIYILFAVVLVALQCTPKTAEKAKGNKEDVTKVDASGKNGIKEDFRSKAPEPGPAPRVQMGDYETFKLDNGLEVIVVENHKIPSVSFQIYVDAPVVAEGDAAGYIDIAGQMLRTGTSTKTKVELDEEIDFMGAYLSTSSSGMYASSLKKHSPTLLGLMSDILLNPSFPADEFDKIKTQTLSALASEKEEASAIAGNVSRVLRNGEDHPYGEVTTEATINNINLEACKAYYNTYFKPNISYLVIVGDVTLADAKGMAEKAFGNWKSNGKVKKTSYDQPEGPDKTEVAFVNKAGAVQSAIRVTYPVDLKPGAPDAIKANVMNTMLGGFFRSYLNNNLREDKGYTYGVRSSLRPNLEIGNFTAYASVRNEVTDSSIVQFIAELNRIRDTRISDEDLTLVKNVMSGNFARDLEDPERVARFALNTARYNLPKDYYTTYLEKISAVSADDIMEMAKKYIRPDKAYIVVVGNKDEVAKKLSPFGEVYHYDNNGVEMDMNELAIPAGVTGKTVIENYLKAIGGVDKLKMVKDNKTVMSGSMQGMGLTFTNYMKAPNKSKIEVAVAGMGVMESTVFNGTKGSSSQMGQAKKAMDATEVAEMKAQRIFTEMEYLTADYKIELKEATNLKGTAVYKVVVITPTDKKSTQYYDMATGLKVQEVAIKEAAGEKITQITNYGDYKEVAGIMYPHAVTISGGAMPPINLKVTELKVNTGLEDSLFE